MKGVVMHTDGSCIGNPGPGGYGVVLLYGAHRKELSGGYRKTTNNRMELMGAIKGLEVLTEGWRVTLHSDSQYVVRAMAEGWAQRWRSSGWRRNKREKAENPDLWVRLLELCAKHEVEFKWVRGHAGNADNERCDELARAAAEGPDLVVDEVYERAEGLKQLEIL